MDFYEYKKITISLLQYMPKEKTIELCRQLENYIIAKGNTTEYSFTGDLLNDYHFRLEDDDVFPENQKRVVIYQTSDYPTLVLVNQPIVILREFLTDLENYLKKHSQEDIDNLNLSETNLSFYYLVRQLSLLLSSNNDTFSRAASLLSTEK